MSEDAALGALKDRAVIQLVQIGVLVGGKARILLTLIEFILRRRNE